ncbi:hypothetical protein [Nocardiopsis potens]|uniref:hypothetical protein n=1 Tax=Nocardiopsis potens TaxID=1246458 RepID=UPI0003499198|nr:hypothetical protein [Nocardiopsis potens]
MEFFGGRRGGDRGSSATEYAALVLLVAALLGAVAVVSVPARVAGLLEYAFCVIGGGKDCGLDPGGDRADAPKDEDYLPPRCEVYQLQDKAGYSMYVGIFKFGEEYAFMEQQMADGTYRLTLMPHNVELGVEGKAFQVKGEGGKNVRLGAEAKIGAYLKAGVGDTWVFKDKAEARSFKDDIIENQMAMDSMARNPGAGLYYALNPPPEIPDPGITTATLRLEAGANAEAGAGVKTSSGETYWDSGTGLNGKIRVGGQVSVRTDRRDPDNPLTGTTYQMDGQLGVGSELGGAGAEDLRNWTGAVRVTRNEEGEPVELVYTTSVEESLVSKDRLGNRYKGGKGGLKDKEGAGILQETRTTLTLDTPEERAIAERYLEEQGLTGMPSLAFSQVFDDGGDLLREPPEGAGEFERLLYDKATVSNTVQEKTTDAAAFGGKVALGLGLGLKLSTESSAAHTVEAEYLGAPRPEGTRGFLDFPDCVSREGR